MIYLSDILTQQHDLEKFEDLLEVARQKARDGEIHLDIDIKPPFQDTPRDWQNQVEMAFTFPNR